MKKRLMILLTGLIAPIFASYCLAAEDNVDIHGFVSQGYLSTTENNFISESKKSTFEFSEIGINFGKELTDKLWAGLQFFARDFGDGSNNEVKIDWAFADYRFQDWLGLRFGLLKTPHGLYNETRDIGAIRTSILLPQSVYQEIMRDVTMSLQGIGINGNIDLNLAGWISYKAMFGTQTVEPNDRMAEALTGIYTDLLANQSIEVDSKYAVGLVWENLLPGLRAGVTYDNTKLKLTEVWVETLIPEVVEEGYNAYADYDNLENWVFSLEYTWNNLILMGEFIQTFKEYELSDFGKYETEPYGWYTGATYRIAEWFELGAYYSDTQYDYPYFDNTPIPPDFYHKLKDVCVSVRFDINHNWILKLEHHSFEGAHGLSAFDNENKSPVPIIPDYFEKDWTMFAAKIMGVF